MKSKRPASPLPSKPASIYDVARRAGVSIKTVSRVVNRQPNVSEQAQARVREAVDALSYRPNFFRARPRQRAGRPHRPALRQSVGKLHGSGADRRTPALREDGYHLIIEQISTQDPNLGAAVRALALQSSLHGLILTPPLCDSPAVLEALKGEHVRFVRIAPRQTLPDSASVSIDDHAAAREMTAYLIGLGHRRIGFIKGHPDHSAAHARFEGYRAALKHAGIPVVEELCAQGYFSYQSGLEAGESLLSLKNRPTAIFASNDDMAAAVLATAQRFHLRLPSQLSVAGFDDSLVAQMVWPPLTTCRPADQGNGRRRRFASGAETDRRRPAGTPAGSRADRASVDGAARALSAPRQQRSGADQTGPGLDDEAGRNRLHVILEPSLGFEPRAEGAVQEKGGVSGQDAAGDQDAIARAIVSATSPANEPRMPQNIAKTRPLSDAGSASACAPIS
ncbi:MAG: LacI family DNA-binding transcriptional regulator [Rhizomicrobium sp.]